MRQLEYRFNFLAWSLIQLFWLGIWLTSVELIFGQVQTIAGWGKNQVLLLAVVQMTFGDIMSVFVRDSLRYFSHWIRHGEFDFVLLKPASTRFMVSGRSFDFDHLVRLFADVLVLLIFLNRLAIQPELSSWLNFFLLLFAGVFALYNIFFTFTTTNFWFTNLFNLDELHASIIDAGRYPLDIFQGKLKSFFTFIIPVAFVGTFPTLALLGKIGFEWAVYGLAIALLSFFVSQAFWRFAIKYYSSASS
jgi:ABC-2 type transport system permease protein